MMGWVRKLGDKLPGWYGPFSHIVAGLVSAFSVIVHPALPFLGGGVFYLYELKDEENDKDPCQEELMEFGVGLFSGFIVLIILKAVMILESVGVI